MVGLLLMANLVGLPGVVRDAPLYTALDLPFRPAVRLGLAGAWSVVLALLLVGLLRRRAWALAWTAPLLTLYGAAGLAWLGLFARADYDQGRIGFQCVVTLLGLGPVWWVAWRNDWFRR